MTLNLYSNMLNINYIKPGSLLKCYKEFYLLYNEEFEPVVLNNNLTFIDIDDLVVYIKEDIFEGKLYYKVLYGEKIYYILSGAFSK